MTAARDIRELLDVQAVRARFGNRLSRSAAYAIMKKLPRRVWAGRRLFVERTLLERWIANGGDWCEREARDSIDADASGGAGDTTRPDGAGSPQPSAETGSPQSTAPASSKGSTRLRLVFPRSRSTVPSKR